MWIAVFSWWKNCIHTHAINHDCHNTVYNRDKCSTYVTVKSSFPSGEFVCVCVWCLMFCHSYPHELFEFSTCKLYYCNIALIGAMSLFLSCSLMNTETRESTLQLIVTSCISSSHRVSPSFKVAPNDMYTFEHMCAYGKLIQFSWSMDAYDFYYIPIWASSRNHLISLCYKIEMKNPKICIRTPS